MIRNVSTFLLRAHNKQPASTFLLYKPRFCVSHLSFKDNANVRTDQILPPKLKNIVTNEILELERNQINSQPTASNQNLAELKARMMRLSQQRGSDYHLAVYDYVKELNKQKQYDAVLRYTNSVLPGKRLGGFISHSIFNQIYAQHLYALWHIPRHRMFDHYIYSPRDSMPVMTKAIWLVLQLAIFLVGVPLLFLWMIGAIGPNSSEASKAGRNGLKLLTEGMNTQIEGEKDIKTRFSDVLGIDEFKEELLDLVDYLKNPDKYVNAGATLPKGILLVGPPGTGKTLLARALAGEAGCTFFYKAGSEFDEEFVGVGARRVRNLFQAARAKAPAIIFIDEIESLAGKRSSSQSGQTRETINQLLAEMDGFKQSENIIVLGATNNESIMDPAIKRPGRFDKTIHVPVPDSSGRQQILKYYLGKVKTDTDVSAESLAKRTTGFTGADIQNLVNIAMLHAIKKDRKKARNEDFEHALDRVRMGVGRTSMLVSLEEKKKTAYHEVGHALTSLFTEGATPLHKVTILPRGGALGFTSLVPEKDNLSYTKKAILAQIDVLMGGRAAEELMYGHDNITTGCRDDLKRATQAAYSYVRELGMQEEASMISASEGINTSDEYNYQLDLQVERILRESYHRVKGLLGHRSKEMQSIVNKLVEEETLSVQQIKQIIGS